jgi:YHS domain-containing protein
MYRSLSTCFGFGLLTILSALAGCSRQGAEPGATGPKSAAKASDEAPGLAELGEVDRQLATAQRTCPVSDALLGTMGAPYKMTVEGKPVFLCCEHCKSEVEKDPDAILANLAK